MGHRRSAGAHIALLVAVVLGLTQEGSADAIKVAVIDRVSSSIRTNLAAAGMDVDAVSISNVEAGQLISGGYDAFLTGRVYYPSTSPSSAYVNAVSSFLTAGGGVVTEWDDTSIFWSGYHSTYRYDSTDPQLGLLTGVIGSGYALATGTPITQAMSHPVWDGLPASFSAQHGTEFFYTSYGYDTSQIDIVATFHGDGSTNFPNQDFPAVFAGKSDRIVGIPFDYQDNANDPNLVTLYTNAVEWVATGGDDPPVADPNGPYVGLWGDVLTLDASGSSDPDGDSIEQYDWDIEDHGTINTDQPTTAFTIPGTREDPGDWTEWSHHLTRLRVYANGAWSAWVETDIYVAPEPATMLLLAGGILAVARRRRRRL